jgi:hypothetical protein
MLDEINKKVSARNPGLSMSPQRVIVGMEKIRWLHPV